MCIRDRGSQDGMLRTLYLNKQEVENHKAHTSSVGCLVYIQKQRRLISLDRNGIAKLWKLEASSLKAENFINESNTLQGEITSGCMFGEELRLMVSHTNGCISWLTL
eukprot:TRINITY_DN0_c3886_g1_i1.p1 TRINITY_DN0_c3886_g1~~TRINITY_DN0_c3886_g1_i1.p1  ORF type:complete len:107 (-),score=19.50 TRINITY_DN0_c3886_g1_i1:68-388(-)